MQKKPTKIVFISIFSYPLFNEESDLPFGGAEVQISLIAKELAKDDDFDISVIVANTGQERKEFYNNVTLRKAYKRGRRVINLLIAPFVLYRTLRSINPEIVICRAAGVEVGISAFYAKINKKRFIYSIAHTKDIDGSRFKGLRGKIFKFGLMNANVLVAQSIDQLDLTKENKKLCEKDIVLIKNSFKQVSNSTPGHLLSPVGDLSCRLGAPCHSELPARSGSGGDSESRKINKKYILWVGRSVELKRPEVFIRLAGELPEYNFVMIFPENKNTLYKKTKKSAREVDNLEIVGKVPFEKIQDYYNKAFLLVNTSTHEGFPNTFIQSSMAGVPMISLKVNPDNFLNKYGCGVACDDDYEKMRDAVNKIMKDKEYSKKLGENAEKYFIENHNIENNILKWKEILKK